MIKKDYIYLITVILFALIMSFSIWKFSESIVYSQSVSIVSKNNGKPSSGIKVSSPKVLEIIESPVLISGKASAKWFYDDSFLIEISDEDGNVLGKGPVTAQASYFSGGMYKFEGIIPFKQSQSSNGFVILYPNEKNNLDIGKSVKIPVIFKLDKVSSKSCTVSGCNQELCSNIEEISACEYKPEYDCLPKAKCEIQQDGRCGWTKTEEYKICLKDIEVKL